MPPFANRAEPAGLFRRFLDINWLLVALIIVVTLAGFAMLYSAAGGQLQPWAGRQMIRFAAGLVLMLVIAVTSLRFWMRWSYGIYLLALALLITVEIIGASGMGARRWIDLGVVQLQPSEFMKVALVLAVARYFNSLRAEEAMRLRALVVPLLLLVAPVILVLRQPDLGTAVLLVLTVSIMLWTVGVRLRIFVAAGIVLLAAIPLAWQFVLYDYQKTRMLTFLYPERDPLGAGYHITQSKIALGSGGVLGKGFMQGSQSHLSFLPERQTDFIFTMLAEEFGLVGALALLLLYLMIILLGLAIAMRARSQFGRLMAGGIMATFFLYVFINIAMVTGLVPVVGVPLPLVSYGGTSMLSLLIGFGLVLCVYVHRDQTLPRYDQD